MERYGGKSGQVGVRPAEKEERVIVLETAAAAGEIAICPLPIDFFFFSRYSVNKSASRFIDDPSPAGQTESTKFQIHRQLRVA